MTVKRSFLITTSATQSRMGVEPRKFVSDTLDANKDGSKRPSLSTSGISEIRYTGNEVDNY